MTNPLDYQSISDAMIFTTDHGPMIISRQHPHPQPVTDPVLLKMLFPDEPQGS